MYTIQFKTGDKVIDMLSNDQATAMILSIDTFAERVLIKFDSGGYGNRKFHEIAKPENYNPILQASLTQTSTGKDS